MDDEALTSILGQVESKIVMKAQLAPLPRGEDRRRRDPQLGTRQIRETSS